MCELDDLEPVPLVRVFLLTFLMVHPESSGYDLMKSIFDFTGGLIELKSGTVYGELRRLEQQGLVQSKREASGRRRRSYTVTERGTQELRLLVAQVRMRMDHLLRPLTNLADSRLKVE